MNYLPTHLPEEKLAALLGKTTRYSLEELAEETRGAAVRQAWARHFLSRPQLKEVAGKADTTASAGEIDA